MARPVVAVCQAGLPGLRMRFRDAKTPASDATVNVRSCHFSPAISIRNEASATASSCRASGGLFAIETAARAVATRVPTDTSNTPAPEKPSVYRAAAAGVREHIEANHP